MQTKNKRQTYFACHHVDTQSDHYDQLQSLSPLNLHLCAQHTESTLHNETLTKVMGEKWQINYRQVTGKFFNIAVCSKDYFIFQDEYRLLCNISVYNRRLRFSFDADIVRLTNARIIIIIIIIHLTTYITLILILTRIGNTSSQNLYCSNN